MQKIQSRSCLPHGFGIVLKEIGKKYDILIKPVEQLAKMGRQHGRSDMVMENKQHILIYTEIRNIIIGGGVIYGHVVRLTGRTQ